MKFNVTATELDLSESDALLVRTVRPTGSLRSCILCGAALISGERCMPCLHERQRVSFKKFGVPYKAGRRSTKRRFSDDEVREMRRSGRYDRAYIRELCYKYKASSFTIYSILSGETYRDVEDYDE